MAFALPYQYAPFGVVKQQLANRLYDSSMTFWTDAELGIYLRESLRTWNALTAYWRDDFLFGSQANGTWYDLTSLTQMPNTLRPFTVLDTDIYTLIQYHLLEPPSAPAPLAIASLQFSPDDIVNAVQRRRDEILAATGCTITRRLVPASATRILLPDTVIDIRRVAYLPSSNTGQPPSTMWPEDTWAEQSFNLEYTVKPAGTPSSYLQTTQPPIAFNTDIPPAYSGQYEVLTIEAGPPLIIGQPQTLLIPDDWTHLLVWGALADLLSRESNAKDLPRAQYCNQRYQMGLKLLQDAPALLALRLNNIPLQIDAVTAADLYNTSWQAQTPAQPNTVLYAGLNLLALTPTPDIGGRPYGLGLYGMGAYGISIPYALTATVVQNAPVPILDGDPVQVSRDDLDALIDYAQHLAAVKMGGAEFLATIPLLDRFLRQASLYSLKLSEIAEFTSKLYSLAARDDQMHPRYQADVSDMGPAPTRMTLV